MSDSVKEGLNHYEVLGLTPSATGDDIENAFNSRMKLPITDDYRLRLRAAYKTLHDPFWRRIYDAELGFDSEARPEPVLSQSPQSATEERVAPFIAAALRQPAGQTEHSPSPETISFPETEEKEPTVEESPEPIIAGIDYATDADAPVRDTRRYRSAWNGAGVATGAVILGLGLVTFLIGLSGNFDRSPRTAGAPASTSVEQKSATRPSVLQQTAPQQVAPIEEESPSLPSATTVTSETAGGADPVPGDGSTAAGAAQASAAGGVADTQVGEESGSGTIANSADSLAPAAAVASTRSTEPPTAAPATVAPAPPAAVAQPASPPPPVRSAPVVNRAAAPRWISGSLVKGDNPRGRYRGTVTVRFTVQPSGRVTGCRTAVSSGNSALDARTCQLVEQRLRFRPALNWQGQAIPYETRAIYTWGAKHRSLLDQLLMPNGR